MSIGTLAMRRVCEERFGGNVAAFARAMGRSREATRHCLTGRSTPNSRWLEDAARAIDREVYQILIPHEHALYTLSEYLTPGNPRYETVMPIVQSVVDALRVKADDE